MKSVNKTPAEASLDAAIRSAAGAADRAVIRTIRKYADENVTDEDDITGCLLGNLDAELDKNIGGIKWSSSILRHRKGVANEERHAGADIILHVLLDTPIKSYSKAVLIQSKRFETADRMSARQLKDLKSQCATMLDITSEAFVFNYGLDGITYCNASQLADYNGKTLSDVCANASKAFFYDLFSCKIGDKKINSALARELPAPFFIELKGKKP